MPNVQSPSHAATFSCFLILALFVGTLGCSGHVHALAKSAPTAAPAATGDAVWIVKNAGAKSCEQGSGQKLQDGAAALKKAGVSVLESKSGQDGKMRAQMCGMSTGDENSYRIKKADLAKALSQGFQVAGSLEKH